MNEFSNQSRQLALQLIQLVYANSWERQIATSAAPDSMIRAMNSCGTEGYYHSEAVVSRVQEPNND